MQSVTLVTAMALPLWATLLMIGMPAVSMFLSTALWWHGLRALEPHRRKWPKYSVTSPPVRR